MIGWQPRPQPGSCGLSGEGMVLSLGTAGSSKDSGRKEPGTSFKVLGGVLFGFWGWDEEMSLETRPGPR